MTLVNLVLALLQQIVRLVILQDRCLIGIEMIPMIPLVLAKRLETVTATVNKGIIPNKIRNATNAINRVPHALIRPLLIAQAANLIIS